MVKHSRRNFTKSVAATLSALPLVSLAISGTGCKVDKKAEQHKQTSPIVVGGGGSVSINFNESYYERVTGTNKFVNKKGDYIHKLRILNKYSSPTPATDPTPKTRDCRIVIHTEDPTGTPSHSLITIYGSPMGVEFDDGQFKLEKPQGADTPIRYNINRKIIGKIQIFEGTATQPTAEYNVPTQGICTIDVLDTM